MTGDPTAPTFGPDWSAGFRRGSDEELRGWVEVALDWCAETDAIAMQHFRRDLALERKPDHTFVTVADRAIEQRLRERITSTFPGHGVIGEEYGTDAGGASVRWYLDPIDATHNYIRGVPVFATLLAVERDGELQAAVISAPALGERWYGWRGGGAWAAGSGGTASGATASGSIASGPAASGSAARATDPRRIAVSRVASLPDAQVLYSSVSDLEASGHAPGFPALRRGAWRERGFGDFWGYCLVAEGAAEVMVEVGLSRWDAAAPVLLVEEAGGRVTDFEGRRSFEGTTIVASNGILHDSVREILIDREERRP